VASAEGAAGRVARAWQRMPAEGRLAAVASVGLFVAMFLPWYQITVRTPSGLDSRTLTAFGDFSWIEAAVLVVAVGVLVLLFTRAEGRAFHLPGGDGTIIFAAGLWATALLVWRAFDKPTATAATAVGLKWGFVFAFASSGFLAWAGFRVRAAHRAEPPLPGEGAAEGAGVGPPSAPAPAAPADPAPVPVAPAWDEAPTVRADEAPTVRSDEAPTVPADEAQTVRSDEARPTAPVRTDPTPTRPHQRIRPRPATPPDQAPTTPRPRPAPDDLTRAHGSEEPLPRDDLT
jgi:hypothetical protein